jgi:predicted Zn-dependent protease
MAKETIKITYSSISEAAADLRKLLKDIQAHKIDTSPFVDSKGQTRDHMGYLEDALTELKTTLGKTVEGTIYGFNRANAEFSRADAKAAKAELTGINHDTDDPTIAVVKADSDFAFNLADEVGVSQIGEHMAETTSQIKVSIDDTELLALEDELLNCFALYTDPSLVTSPLPESYQQADPSQLMASGINLGLGTSAAAGQ